MLLQPTPPTPSAPPSYPPPSAYAPPSRPPRSLTTDNLVVLLGIGVGTLITVGLIAYHALFLISPYCTGFGCPSPPPTPTAAQTLAVSLAWVFVIAMDLAVGLSVCLAFIVGGTKSELPESTKRGVSTFAVVFLAVWIIFGTSAISSVLALLFRL